MSLADDIQKALPTLSKSERRIAQIIQSTNLVAGLETVARLAVNSKVSGPTVLRFIAKLEYGNYAEFQDAIRRELSDRVSSPLQLFDSRAPKPNRHALLQDARSTFVRGIERTFDRLIEEDFETVVDLVSDKSRTVYLAGGRFSQHLAELLWGHIAQLRPDVHVLRHAVLSPHDRLLDMKRRDVLIVFDMRRYQSDVIDLAEIAKARQAMIVLITDQWLSPIARVAHHALTCDVEAPSPYDSLVCCMALVEAIVAGVTLRRGEEGRQRIEKLEELRGQVTPLASSRDRPTPKAEKGSSDVGSR